MLVIKGLHKHFADCHVLRGVDLSLDQGAGLYLSGKSGSGKTTLLRLIAGLEQLDGGEIWLDGTLASSRAGYLPPHQRGIGFVFDEPALWPHMTVAGNIAFGLARLPVSEQRQRLEDWLAKVGLAGFNARRPHQLSAGQARRVALARALAPEPRLLLLDEPFVNLEPELSAELEQIIAAEANRRRCSYVYIAHSETALGRQARLKYRLSAGVLTTPAAGSPDRTDGG